MTFDWDAWRTAYDAMTHADQQAFYDHIFPLIGRQASYDLESVLAFITEDVRTVVEYGGYDGGLAADVLAQRPKITSWRNYEISRIAALNLNVCTDPRYLATILDLPIWECDRGTPDVALSCHMIEHIRADELAALIVTEKAPRVLFNAPLTENGQAWEGYDGTHILEWGWNQIGDAMRRSGFERTSAAAETRTWSR